MPFTEEQRQALKAKLRYRHVKTRAYGGTPISYIEGWHVIAEANRIFGYDCWDRQTLSPRCLWRETQRGETTCFYTAKVRVTVRAGEAVVVREGIGTGTGRAGAAETAHEIALKAAETDATKRALATFGNPFGLALYDKEQRGVTRRHRHALEPDVSPSLPVGGELELHHAEGRIERFASTEAFLSAALQAIKTQQSVHALYAFWESHLTSFAALPRKGSEEDSMRVIGMAMKERVRALARKDPSSNASTDRSASTQSVMGKSSVKEPSSERGRAVDATREIPAGGQLAFPKEKRVRDKAHLAFVASQPCLVCGRRPAYAHHIRFAQPRALGLKVSDEFTVPLCNGHHDSLHHTGDERAWWARHGILDPLQIANRLWAASRGKTGEGMPTVANGQSQSEVSTGTAAEEPPW